MMADQLYNLKYHNLDVWAHYQKHWRSPARQVYDLAGCLKVVVAGSTIWARFIFGPTIAIAQSPSSYSNYDWFI